jgi:pullulanase/glycogen debranching enzyme
LVALYKHKHKTNGKTKNKMGERRLEGHMTESRNARMEVRSRRQRRMEGLLREVMVQKGL